MKKTLLILLALAMLHAGLCATAEGDFAAVAGVYELSSGVGAWFTELTLEDDGSFRGYYQDTDMDAGELNGVAYEATIYCARFTGRLSAPAAGDGGELTCTVAELDYDAGEPYTSDGALYVPTPPNGVGVNDRLHFYPEGMPAADLPEEFLVWVRMREGGIRWESMPCRGLYNETADAGFSGIATTAEVWLPQPAEATPGPRSEWTFLIPTPAATQAPGETPQPTRTVPPVEEGIEYPVPAVVVNCRSGVSLRSAPSTKAERLAEVPLDETVQVHSNAAYAGNDRWFVEASYAGRRGYICVEYLDILLPEALRYQREYLRGLSGTVSAVNPGTDLILRDGPGTDYDSLGLLFGGEVLGYTGESRRDGAGTCWYRCSHYGEDCWISAKYTALTLNDGSTYTGGRGNL